MIVEEAITDLLNQARCGDHAASNRAFERVYDELKRIAQNALGRKQNETLSASALVHEAFLKLVPEQQARLEDRQHFFRLAARAMRQVLVDYSRRCAAERRGGAWIRTEITDSLKDSARPMPDLLAVDQALTRLELRVPKLAQIVEWHFFAGLSFEEIASELGNSDRSVRRDWETARVMLLRDLADRPAL